MTLKYQGNNDARFLIEKTRILESVHCILDATNVLFEFLALYITRNGYVLTVSLLIFKFSTLFSLFSFSYAILYKF